jgi:hypothetical protein
VKQQHSEEIECRKDRLNERLGRDSWPDKGGRVLAGGNERLSMSRRVHATAFGGIGLVHRLVRQIGLPKLIDDTVQVFKVRCPYHESDHVLNIAYNIVCGGRTLDDIELRRQDEAYMDALGAVRIPDPTTAGDFLRRLDRGQIDALSEAINTARIRVWKKNKRSFFERALIDVDGTIAGTQGECKEGMDMSYKGIWGYAPLLVTLANTGEILYTRNRPGNRPSHDGCFDYLDPAVDLAREAGFRKVRLRGDGHFSLTDDFDYWTKQKVEFVFGVPAHPKLVGIAEGQDERTWRRLRRKGRSSMSRRGARKPRIKQAIIEERGYKNLELEHEDYAEFAYRPIKCSRDYRVVVLRKTISVKQGQDLLIPEIRYHFYITNAPKSELTARQVIRESNQRCNQENLIEQTKNGVHAMRMPCDTLLANDAYMLIACLAWNVKAWAAQLWPDREQGDQLRRMEFRRFVASIIAIPCQVVRTGRHIVHRFLGYSRWLDAILRAHTHFKRLAFV